jgi:hypothetical protein
LDRVIRRCGLESGAGSAFAPNENVEVHAGTDETGRSVHTLGGITCHVSYLELVEERASDVLGTAQ